MFTVIDLSRITLEDLVRCPRPIRHWPTVKIDVDSNRASTCIATWRRDVVSDDELSSRLSECAWDALNLGFSYMLCDIVSLPQNAPDIAQRVIEFSRYYESLHAVIAYEVDPDLQRCWLRHEAITLLKSPTSLAYIHHKWKLAIPLIFSLVVRQVCTRRLGLQEVNTEHLHLCDTEAARRMTLRDLDLLSIRSNIRTIALDRRHQTFASDVVLVYELGRPRQRDILIEKLQALKTNSIVAPALTVIWAMVEGLSVSVRGCDWDVHSVMQLTRDVLRTGCCSVGNALTFREAEDGLLLSVEGAIQGTLRFGLQAHDRVRGISKDGFTDLLVRAWDLPATANYESALDELFDACVVFMQNFLSNTEGLEPPALTADDPQYGILFDETPYHDRKTDDPF